MLRNFRFCLLVIAQLKIELQCEAVCLTWFALWKDVATDLLSGNFRNCGGDFPS